MRIFVKVKAGSKVEKIERLGENNFSVNVKSPPTEGKANERVILLISEYFGVPRSRVRIISGFTSKNKVIEIEE